jgi:hypothetical protein
VITGGQFGKVFVRQLKTKKSVELIDKAQAHKRKVIVIITSKDYIFTAAADQKVKQWTMSEFQIVWSEAIDWIPTTLALGNGSIFVGGPSRISSFGLQYLELPESSQNSLKATIKSPTAPKEVISYTSTTPVEWIVISVLSAVAIAGILVYRNARLVKKPETGHTDSTTQHVSVETQTLVTQILKIALPGYKELHALDFLVLRSLTRGGGGEIFLGESLSKRSTIHGKQVIVKKFPGMPLRINI